MLHITDYYALKQNDEPVFASEQQIPLNFESSQNCVGKLRLLSLFSGCGGMDIGFEGGFIAPRKSFAPKSCCIDHIIDEEWLCLKQNNFITVFANDILSEAKVAWNAYMSRHGYEEDIYNLTSIVDLVKMHRAGANIFPQNIDVVTGGFPCQDFSVAGKRKGFNSTKDHEGNIRTDDVPTEESRGKLYYWMKQVIDIVRPKVFIAENVKGLVTLGNVKDIIQKDFASADGDGYIVLTPQILNAANYGVPESRERVIFIGIRRNALTPNALKALTSNEIADKYNPYPTITHSYSVPEKFLLPAVTTNDILSSLPEPEYSHDPSQQIYSKAKYLSHGQGQAEIRLNNVGPTIRSEHHGNIEFRRLSLEHGGTHIEELKAGLQERRLTVRECALIQSFPPDYPFIIKREQGRGFLLSSSGAYKVIGNAVPPILAYHIAKRLQEVWPLYFEQ